MQDAMVVPLGWTLDDRRREQPPLFTTRTVPPARRAQDVPRRLHRRRAPNPLAGEQLELDGTGEIGRPLVDDVSDAGADPVGADDAGAGHEPWSPDFDADDDLDGLLGADSPLLARAFRGTGRPRR